MQIQNSHPNDEGYVQAFISNVIVFTALFTLFVFSGVGIVFIAYFLKLLALFIPNVKSIIAALLLMYVVLTLLTLALKQTSEAIRISIATIDHFVTRLLGYLVVGISDIWNGSRIAAAIAYGAILAANLGAEIVFVVYFLDDSDWGKEAWRLLSGDATATTPLKHLFLAGSVLSMSSMLALLPLGMVFRKRWWQMVLRPTLVTHVGYPPANRPSAPLKEVRVAHLSDLHFESTATSPINRAAQSALKAASAASDIDAVVLTGDITDIGTADQWNQFLALPETLALREKLVLVPGNHDLNPVHEKSKLKSASALESPSLKQTQARATNFLRAADLVMGDRCHAICPFTGAWSSLKHIIARAQPDLDRWSRGETAAPQALLPHELYERIFPFVVTTPHLEGLSFVVWNSVWLARWPVNNSMGEIHQEQLRRAGDVIKHVRTSDAVAHLMHHQAGVPDSSPCCRDAEISRFKRGHAIGMGIRNPNELLSWISERRQRTLLLHGHRHKYFVARAQGHDITIVSCPSATKTIEMSWDPKVPCGMPGAWLELGIRIDGPHCELTGVRAVRSAPSSI